MISIPAQSTLIIIETLHINVNLFHRISAKPGDVTNAVSESSSEEEGEVDDLIETEFSRDVRVQRRGGGPKQRKRRKGDLHSASSSSNASSSVQR